MLVVRGDFGGGSFVFDFNTFGFSDLGFFTLLDSSTTQVLGLVELLLIWSFLLTLVVNGVTVLTGVC